MTDHEDTLSDDLRAAMAGEIEPEDIEDGGNPLAPEREAPPEEAAPDDTPGEEDDVSFRDEFKARQQSTQVQPPEHWSAEDREFFAGLPSDDVRSRVLDWRKQIERGAQEKFGEAAKVRKEVEELDQYLAPMADEMRAAGMSRADTTKVILGAWSALGADPINGIARVAQHFGRSVAGTEQAQEVVRQVAAALHVTLGGNGQALGTDPTSARIAALEAQLQARQQQEEMARQRAYQETVDAVGQRLSEFAQAKDEAGQALHPHFEAVKPLMGTMMQAAAASGETLELDEAYERAVWSRPDLREAMLKRNGGEAARRAAAASRQHAQRARVAHTPKSTSMARAIDAEADDAPVRDLLKAAWREQSGSARI